MSDPHRRPRERQPLSLVVPESSALPPLVGEVFRRTVGADNVHVALDTALDIIEHTMEPTWCAVWLFDTATDTWFISHSRNLSYEAAELRFSRGSAIPCLVGERGVPQRLDDLDGGTFQRSADEHYRMLSALYVPMVVRSRPVGVIALYSDQPAHFTADDESQLCLVAAHLGQLVTALSLLDERGRVHQLDARERVARDLHDGMLQTLSSLQLYVYSTREAMDEGDVVEQAALVNLLSTTLSDAIAELRSQIAGLRSLTVLRSLNWMLERMQGRLESAGLTVRLPTDCFELNPAVSDALASVAREASNNILKHSDASTVAFSLRPEGATLVFECVDDGRGLNSDSDELRGLGLTLLSEVVAGVGGTLEHESLQDKGFLLRCRVPWTSHGD